MKQIHLSRGDIPDLKIGLSIQGGFFESHKKRSERGEFVDDFYFFFYILTCERIPFQGFYPGYFPGGPVRFCL